MRASVLACLTLLAHPATAQWSGWDYDRDQPKEALKELKFKLPEFPRDPDLLQFEGGGASRHRFFVDPKALSIGTDGIVRYTLVVKTGGGATNVSYEGMLCELRQVKVYAWGRRDGTWVRARDPQWTRIETRQINVHHGVLFRDYFCAGKTDKGPVVRVKEALDLLRYGPREELAE